MQQSITIRLARRSFSIKAWLNEKSQVIKHWWLADSPTFTTLCGERFTRKEVVLMHIYAMAVLVACIVASWLEGGEL